MTAAESPDLILRHGRIEGVGIVDVHIHHGRIVEIGPDIAADDADELEVSERLLSPAFVQPHIHLDKVGLAAAVGPNETGTLAEAISLLHLAKREATVEDVARRAKVVIEQAVLSGTTYIRSHVDVDTIGGLTPLRGVLRAAREMADICDVQIVAFPQEGLIRDPGAFELMTQAMEEGADVVGGMPHWERNAAEARQHIEDCLALAQRVDADVDMHVDETDDPSSRTLEILLDTADRLGWAERVTASHCCAMAAWEEDYVMRTVERIASVGASVITNPVTNLLLQGRGDGLTPRRGLPPVKALMAAGVRVGCGQDCVQDAFYPFGNADPLQVALVLCHAAQLSLPDEIAHAIASVRETAAAIVGLDTYGLKPGAIANIVVLDAPTAAEAMRLQAPRRWVIHGGRIVAETETRSILRRAISDGADGGLLIPSVHQPQEHL